jgi:hypothetical protein
MSNVTTKEKGAMNAAKSVDRTFHGVEIGAAIRQALATGNGATDEELEGMRIASEVAAIYEAVGVPPRLGPPLTVGQAFAGEGGEERQNRFWQDFHTLRARAFRIYRAGGGTPEQRARFAATFDLTDETMEDER